MLDKREHLRQRRLLLPPFHGERMHAYGHAMLDLADESVDSWPIGKPFSVHRKLQAITLRVILRTIFGVDAGARFDQLETQITELTDIAAWAPLLLPFMQVDLGPYSPWGRYKRKSAVGDAMLLAEIAGRRRMGTAGRSDVLSMLIDARDEQGAPMSDAELRDELVTLLIAGHETTATALAWALRWILASPSVHERLVEEIRGAVENGAPMPERIATLELLDAVVRETLRLQPVIPIVGRILDHDATIGGYALPAGTGVLCSIYLAQRRPSVYPDSGRFDPDRFIGKKLTPYEFFPFGGGVRRCIGMAFALYEMKMVLARVLARARLRLAKSGSIRVIRRSITLAPAGGLPVVLDRRAPNVRAA
jgi:cytochrome P450